MNLFGTSSFIDGIWICSQLVFQFLHKPHWEKKRSRQIISTEGNSESRVFCFPQFFNFGCFEFLQFLLIQCLLLLLCCNTRNLEKMETKFHLLIQSLFIEETFSSPALISLLVFYAKVFFFLVTIKLQKIWGVFSSTCFCA